MMGRKNGQIEMLIFDPEDVIPERHLLRKIVKLVTYEYPAQEAPNTTVKPLYGVRFMQAAAILHSFGAINESELKNTIP